MQTALTQDGKGFWNLEGLGFPIASSVENPSHADCCVEIHPIVVADSAVDVALGCEYTCTRDSRNGRRVVRGSNLDVMRRTGTGVCEANSPSPERDVHEVRRFWYHRLCADHGSPLIKFLFESDLEFIQRVRHFLRRRIGRAGLTFCALRIPPGKGTNYKAQDSQSETRPNVPLLNPPLLRKHHHADESSANPTTASGPRGDA